MSSYGNLQKYHNPNLIQQWLLTRFLDRVNALVASLAPSQILDAGCAEGFVVQRLLENDLKTFFVGIDIDESALRRGLPMCPIMHRGKANITELPFPDVAFDMVICTEVLEHLADPSLALGELKRVSRRYVLLSVPHEPWFRMSNFLRGKHLRQWGNDPEHIQNWGKRQFEEFVGSRLKIINSYSVFPWLLILAQNVDDIRSRKPGNEN
jgi:SAM-dependent methyltransferase